jgi:hypothetical protein
MPTWVDDRDAPDLGDSDADVLMQRSAAVAHATGRLVELIAVPFGQEARVFWRGDFWTEVFQPGAFKDFIRSGKLPRVNREHRRGDTIGKVVELRETPEGSLPRSSSRIRLAVASLSSSPGKTC